MRKGQKHSDLTRAKMSQSHIGKTQPESTKQKISEKNKGRVMPQEAVDRMIATRARKRQEVMHHGTE